MYQAPRSRLASARASAGGSRRAGVAPLVVFLIVVLVVVGAAAAADGKGKAKQKAGKQASEKVEAVSQWLADQAAATRDAGGEATQQINADAISHDRSGGGTYVALITSGAGLFGVAARMAQRSRKLKWRPASAFEAGRVLAYAVFATTGTQAMEALSRVRGVGPISTWQITGETADIVLDEKRRASCEEVAGFLSGAFETVWGRDVQVTHPDCGHKKKGPCTYRVTAAPPAAK